MCTGGRKTGVAVQRDDILPGLRAQRPTPRQRAGQHTAAGRRTDHPARPRTLCCQLCIFTLLLFRDMTAINIDTR